MSRNTQAIISLDNIRSNFLLANQWAPKSKNMAVIKADAYGHGLVAVAEALQSLVPAFAVAIFDEAVVLRNAGSTKNILILQGVCCATELIFASQNNLWITLHNKQQLDLLLATPLKLPLKVWLKLDTGMHRLGLNQKQLNECLGFIKECPWIEDDFVISSHFSCASELASDESRTQLNNFKNMIREAKVPSEIELSLSNSPAIANLPESNLDWNRPGIMLYGLPLFDGPHGSDQQLKAAMSFESEVVAIREVEVGEYVGYSKQWKATRPSKIATVAVGYADGYPRQAINGTPVLVNGERASLAGVVSMDLIGVDVTDLSNVSIGDPVELWGEHLSANEVASYANTIGYDLISGVSRRVPRVYK
jgi:alanine racemase